MAKGQRKSNRQAKKPKKTAERFKSAAILISNQAPRASYQDRVKKGAKPHG
jgi:hypothetical protein